MFWGKIEWIPPASPPPSQLRLTRRKLGTQHAHFQLERKSPHIFLALYPEQIPVASLHSRASPPSSHSAIPPPPPPLAALSITSFDGMYNAFHRDVVFHRCRPRWPSGEPPRPPLPHSPTPRGGAPPSPPPPRGWREGVGTWEPESLEDPPPGMPRRPLGGGDNNRSSERPSGPLPPLPPMGGRAWESGSLEEPPARPPQG